jgi:hypothetical protein
MYNVTDITELVRHHLVLSVDDDETADANLAQLMRSIEQMMTSKPHHFVEWITCDECGSSVCTELIDPEATAWSADGGFHCSECGFADEEP